MRARVMVTGVVQGVGFRPFVHRLAVTRGLSGWVRNTSSGVEIEVEGRAAEVAAFTVELRELKPPAAWVSQIRSHEIAPRHETGFEILTSGEAPGGSQPLPPDLAVCADCRRELLDPSDRRHGYAFTNCTNCGPRFTIIRGVPYDRPLTTMAGFAMCAECAREYADPGNRRFHAQPNACGSCGPRLSFVGQNGELATGEPLELASRLLERGGILAVKGLGGFHLACDASRSGTVAELRRRKGRWGKPLAVMMADLEMVRRHCRPSTQEEALLTSPEAPIMLLPWVRPSSLICDEVAPGLHFLGVMVASTPLHVLLLERLRVPLVMTSGNRSDEPIACDNDEALRRLGPLADGFLVHDRPIVARCDDSVCLVESGLRPIRRARGYAPRPLPLPFDSRPVLACGANEKNTFCLSRGPQAFVSPHIGDMENLETVAHFRSMVAHYRRLFRISPAAVAHDLHPDYLATREAQELAQAEGLPAIPCQHHHAHVVACMVDSGAWGRVVGVAFDGTGLGSDGAIWGGEFLVADLAGFERAAHLEYLPLPGGAAAIRRPARMAAAFLQALLAPDEAEAELFRTGLSPEEAGLVRHQVAGGLNSPPTSSAGRLFDAVSALLGLCRTASYEGEAAVLLEMAAHRAEGEVGAYPFALGRSPSGCDVVLLAPLLRGLLADLRRGIETEVIARRFHVTVAEIVLSVAAGIAAAQGIAEVALTGGVFQNRLLARLAADRLRAAGLRVLLHGQVPCNDGGISLGQAVIAHHRLERRGRSWGGKSESK